jgi:uncharacterized protein YdeI (YjbR/CyaY-like superfamily)
MSSADDYFEKDCVFKDGIELLRTLALSTEMEEHKKWGAPVYTVGNKNVLGILAFKNHFALWFFNGVYLRDPEAVLENAQEGKTKAMRHWKFRSADEIDKNLVLAYIQEAIENQKRGLALKPDRKKNTVVPDLLKEALAQNNRLNEQFWALSPYKQREYCEYIETAKQQKTKLTRLEKIIPMIELGIGLSDKYRKS